MTKKRRAVRFSCFHGWSLWVLIYGWRTKSNLALARRIKSDGNSQVKFEKMIFLLLSLRKECFASRLLRMTRAAYSLRNYPFWSSYSQTGIRFVKLEWFLFPWLWKVTSGVFELCPTIQAQKDTPIDELHIKEKDLRGKKRTNPSECLTRPCQP